MRCESRLLAYSVGQLFLGELFSAYGISLLRLGMCALSFHLGASRYNSGFGADIYRGLILLFCQSNLSFPLYSKSFDGD